MTNVISIRNLNKFYGDFPVYSILNLDVKEHSSTALLGSNGCGITTLMKCILGFTNVNNGSIYVFDDAVVENGKTNSKLLTNARSKIGFIPDQNEFYDHLSKFEYLNLMFNLTIPEYPGKRDDGIEIVNKILKEFRLDRWSYRLIHTLSTGTKQKLAFASCLVHRPQLLIMDEPFRGIDPEAHFMFVQSLVDFRTKGIPLFGIKEPGSIFMSSHILTDIEKICDNLIVMDEYGQIVLTGEMNEVKEKFLGDKKFEELLYLILHEEDEKEDETILTEDKELLDSEEIEK